MKSLLLSALLIAVLNACGDKNAVTPVPAPAPVAAAPTVVAPSTVPDVGKIEQVQVSAKGVGMTPGAAVNDALKTAVMQVNGVAVDASSTNLSVIANTIAQIDVYSNQGHDSALAIGQLKGQAFAEQIVTQSNGLVSSFKVLNIAAPTTAGGSYGVDIEASIAKFKAPADAGKIKIVVAPLRSKQASFNIGGRTVPADDVLEPLHRQIVDALTQTGRFAVLDRQFEGEIQRELEMIGSGQTVNTDIAKLGQALSADLIWIGEVYALTYEKHVRKLQTSDRDLVSYSGGWSVSQRMVNVATRQIQQSSTLQGVAPSIAPTTLSTGFDANRTLAGMQADIVKSATEAILLRSFPISIVERNGNEVVLSQGGSALKEKSRYRVYLLGKEIKDPQTGQSLGNMEQECCELVIKRVTPSVSYATLENILIKLDVVQPGALQIREALAATTIKGGDNTAVAAVAGVGKPATVSAAKRAGIPDAPADKAKVKDDW